MTLSASPPAIALLQRYFAAFENPLRSQDPKALLGEHLAVYDRYPHRCLCASPAIWEWPKRCRT